MRKLLSWWARGHVHTTAALDDHANALRELQVQTQHLSNVVTAIEPLAKSASQISDRLPGELRASVDDLSARVGALHERLTDLERVVRQLSEVAAPTRAVD